MATPIHFKDPDTGELAKLIQNAVAVAPPEYSFSYNATLGTDDTPVEVVAPSPAKIFCITGLILVGNKNISTSIDATVTVYEADPTDTATSIRTIIQLPVARSGQIILTNTFICTREAAHIMAQTTDDDVFVTILGYYIDA
jgi:hypothetical protein